MTANLQLVPFVHGDIVTLRIGGNVFVVMPPVVSNMGLEWEPQRKRILRHPIMEEGTSIMEVPSAGGLQSMTVMTLEAFHTFLVTLHPDRITDPEVRERVLAYQRRAFRAVFEHFHGPLRIAPGKPASVADLIRTGNALKTERNRTIRAMLWQRMDWIAENWGVARPARAIGFDEPDQTDLLTEFWKSIRSLEELGHTTNMSRRNDQLALHLPTIRQHFAEIRVPIDIDRALMTALRASTEPRIVTDKPVNCRDGISRHCWVFSTLPDLFEAG